MQKKARSRTETQSITLNSGRTTINHKIIKAPAEVLYKAFTDPSALTVWQAPGKMTGKVHHFDLKVDGGYQMSIFYPPSEVEARGKTSEKEDRFYARFVQLTPNKKIVEAITFDSDNPAFAGEMIMEVTFEPIGVETRVTILFEEIPTGINPEDNEIGTQLSLEKLAAYVEKK